MAGILLVAAFTVQTLQLTSAMFVHEASSVLLKPPTIINSSDFGFAMAYRSSLKSLVISAPSADLMGKVYTCELTDAADMDSIECYENFFYLESPKNFSRTVNPDQHFYMGATILANSEYVFTCAPLLTADVQSNSGYMPDVYGTCYARLDEPDGTENLTRYEGTMERYQHNSDSITNLRSFIGGTGWSTLMDEENDLLLIVKTSLDGDFVHTPMSKPLGKTSSLVLTSMAVAKKLHRYFNLGIGITAGKFFSEQTVYAFSMETSDMKGVISFLEYDSSNRSLNVITNGGSRELYKLENKEEIGAMFGSVLSAADLNMDGKHELLVGAPAQTSETIDTAEKCVECGAVHIYIGGDKNTFEQRNSLRTILGNKVHSRFGCAIAAGNFDGDRLPELVISAPYEDDGLGAVYILSGYEMYRNLIKYEVYRRVQLSDLKRTQRIQKQLFRTLGYSLQFVGDTDDNGCNELVVGSPGSARALMLKCIQTINITMTTKLTTEQVKESDNRFTVEVCARVDLHELPQDIIGNISVTNSIIGEATYIPDPTFWIDISCYECNRSRTFCENATVVLKDNDPRDYTFVVDAELGVDHMLQENSTEFNTTWVVASPYSQLVKRMPVSRHCKGNDCIPKLSMQVLWSGGESRNYILGSTNNETMTIVVSNAGNASFGSCVWLRVRGAPVTHVACKSENEDYACSLPIPMKRNMEYSIDLIVNMTKPINYEKNMSVEAVLYENCNQRNVFSDKKSLVIPYGYKTDDVHVVGIPHYRNVTDKQISMSSYIYDNQEFLIINNGSITWKNITAILSVEKKNFVNAFRILETGRECEDASIHNILSLRCIIDLQANSTLKITTSIEIVNSMIKDSLYKGKLNSTNLLKLLLQPSPDFKSGIVISEIKYLEELTIGNNKLLIAIIAAIVALILLAILTYVLYRYGFFRREQKKRLHVLRESRRQSQSRRPTVVSEAKDDNLAGLQMEVSEDSPFDNQGPQHNDSIQLVDQTRENH
ncbi:integrin alpha-9-like [Trichoplusia ni]|uniref:Integrin alpha-9-like n=1 Tax=Trichoplusia ni TaxID=7111 RepID=A0A7E5V8X3_TRINI|nr:integrin alpha-9-like [Trichoplusia ni]XP_026724739.1 integrin alpha-9-like [Trichoplusia ni]